MKTKEQWLSHFGKHLDEFYETVEYVSKEVEFDAEENEDCEPVLVSIMLMMASETGGEVTITETDLVFLNEYMKMINSIHKLVKGGFVTECKETDEYGMPRVTMTEAQFQLWM